MMLLDGKKTAAELGAGLQTKVKALIDSGVVPKLVIYKVSDDPASAIYIRMKTAKAAELGLVSEVREMQNQTQTETIESIQRDNTDPTVHGMIVQLPVAEQFNRYALIEAIDPAKDVDGLTSINQWYLTTNQDRGYLPATTKGILALLDAYKIELIGARIVVVGRSNLVGKPTALALLNRDATVTICHSRTKELAELTKTADVLVVVVGQPGLVTKDMVKEGAVVVDVGITKIDHGVAGDVETQEVATRAAAISPVPGGVGPMTVIGLMINVVSAAERQNSP